MDNFMDIANHMLSELKDEQNPTAFIESTFKIDDFTEGVTLSSYGINLSNDFKKYIGDGFLWVKYSNEDNGTLSVIFSCDPDIDMERFEKNEYLAELMSAKAVNIDVDDILNMMRIEIQDVNDSFDKELANILAAAAVLVMS